MKWLSRKEEMVLLIIWKLQDNAYGARIRGYIVKVTGETWSIGALYDVLDRLSRKGYVNTRVSDPVPERGGRSKRLYKVSKTGYGALEEVLTLQSAIWSDLPELVFEEE